MRIRSADHSAVDAGRMTTAAASPTSPSSREAARTPGRRRASGRTTARDRRTEPVPPPIRHAARRRAEPSESRQPDQEHADTGGRPQQPDRHGHPADDGAASDDRRRGWLRCSRQLRHACICCRFRERRNPAGARRTRAVRPEPLGTTGEIGRTSSAGAATATTTPTASTSPRPSSRADKGRRRAPGAGSAGTLTVNTASRLITAPPPRSRRFCPVRRRGRRL